MRLRVLFAVGSGTVARVAKSLKTGGAVAFLRSEEGTLDSCRELVAVYMSVTVRV